MSASSTTFAIDNGDIAIENGRFKIASGKDSYLVIIHTAIHTLLGECILNPDVGIDYFDTIFNIEKPNGRGAFLSRVKNLVSSYDFVTSISKCELEILSDDSHAAVLDLVVETDDGTVADSFDVSQTQVAIVDPGATLPLEGQSLSISTFDGSFSAAKKVAETLGGTDSSGTAATGTASVDFTGMSGKNFSVSTVDGFVDTVSEVGQSVGVGVTRTNMDNVHTGLKNIIEALGGSI